MLTPAFIYQNSDNVVEGLKKRYFENPQSVVDNIISLYQERNSIQKELDELKRKVNVISKEIGELYKTKQVAKAQSLKEQSIETKQRIRSLEDTFGSKNTALNNILLTIPNTPNQLVVKGKNDTENESIFQKGTIKDLASDAKPHWDLIEKYDIVDFPMGVKVAGSGFPFYKGKGAALQRAMVQFFLNEGIQKGYQEIQTPLLINVDSGYGTGQLPDKEQQMYYIDSDKHYLIPTAEVPLVNMYRGTIIPVKSLPIRLIAYSPCFRREAGSWGSQVRGLNRVHQFDKVELVQFTKPEDSYSALDDMCLHVENLLEKLELPYRKQRLCGGDMGFAAAMTYDYEVYAEAQKKWLEVSSVSNCEQFQASRAKIRYRAEDGSPHYPHTLNGSALALPRILASVLENNQKSEKITIPKVLQPFCGFDFI